MDQLAVGTFGKRAGEVALASEQEAMAMLKAENADVVLTQWS